MNTGLLQSSGSLDSFARSLSSDSQMITFKTTGASGNELTHNVSAISDGAMVKSEDVANNSNNVGGHLDALAEAAASATSVLSDLMNTTTSTGAASTSSSPSPAMTIVSASNQLQQHHPTTTTIKFFDASSKQFTLSSPLLQSPVNPPTNILSTSNGTSAAPATVHTVVTTIQGSTTTSGKTTTPAKSFRGGAKTKDEKEEVSVYFLFFFHTS